jgi:hypothetical protein
MIPTLRTLTRKTKLRFGKNKDLTVQKMIDLNKKLSLISAYYKLTSINFTEDILDELGITKDYRIQKPSANKEEYYNFLNNNYSYRIKDNCGGADKLKRELKPFSKSKLQAYNQGR